MNNRRVNKKLKVSKFIFKFTNVRSVKLEDIREILRKLKLIINQRKAKRKRKKHDCFKAKKDTKYLRRKRGRLH